MPFLCLLLLLVVEVERNALLIVLPSSACFSDDLGLVFFG